MSCPVCADDTDPKWTPFCSRRCADVDLARWLGGRYALPGDDGDAMLEAEIEDQRPHRPN